ncbi:FadR/GntR family transcriptional regulator [Microbacterium indicum]|uniref:FadR/GntR family transcriptional regulator n=1 Tax=Microbacterium indicum TaxID=358100 RepID=UPI00048DEF68|nr:FCD domain-containing protein [Microbacterium indicum]
MAEAPAPKAWRVVLEHVESQLRGGSLGPGDRLAGERELASRLGVGRSSVREALRVLEGMGVLRTATGSGPSSGAMIMTSAGSGVANVLGLQAAAQAFRFDDIVDTRLILEDAIVGALAADAELGLAEAERILDAMDAEGLPREEFLALDARFHSALAEATGNRVIATIMTGLRAAIEAYVQHGATDVADWAAERDLLQREHRGVLGAVRGGDAEAARDRIGQHITGYYERTKAPERA